MCRIYLETFPPGEGGGPDEPRPSQFPMDKYGIQVYKPDTQPVNLLGDAVVHMMRFTDPTITKYYDDFEESLTPQQEALLHRQYNHHVTYNGEKRPYDEWYKQSGLTQLFGGYAFGGTKKWPESEYTPEQLKMFDQMMQYLQSQGQQPQEGGPENALISFAPVNFGAATEPNAMAQIGQALSQYPTDVASSQLQNQQIGQQLLAPYLKMLKANKALENNQSFMGTINHIAKQYSIPIPTIGEESDTTTDQGAQGTQPAQPGTTPPAVQGSQPAPPAIKPGPNSAMTMAPATQVPQIATPSIPGMVPGAQATQPVPPSPVTQNAQGRR